MIRILAITDCYLPGFKAGGPVRSVSNMVAALGGSEFAFYVLTRDRDLTDTEPYPGVPIGSWSPVGKAKVLYAADQSLSSLRRYINAADPHILYLNSFFSRLSIKVLLLRRLGLLRQRHVVVAPRGELSPGAMGIKAGKKRLFMAMARIAGLYRNVLWHASAAREKDEIRELLSAFRLENRKPTIHIASNIAGEPCAQDISGRMLDKRPGHVSFLFVSRVSRKKNLAAAIDLVASVRGDVIFDIYGPVDDSGYWQECQQAMANAPGNAHIRYIGAVPHDEARKKFAQYHFFLFPTLSENFGHVIVEALSGGCPVIVSDQTPWSNLEAKGIGWDLPLEDPNRWRQVLQACADMDAEIYGQMSRTCLDFVREWACSPAIRDENVRLFRKALGQSETEGEKDHLPKKDVADEVASH